MKIVLHGKINKETNSIVFEPYNRARLIEFVKEAPSEDFRFEITDTSRPKSDELLGYYWGAILPAIICHNKNLPYHFLNVKDYLKQKKITKDEIDEMHWTLMTEFRPMMVFDLKSGRPIKQRGEMSKMNNRAAGEYIDEVTEWMSSNGIGVPDPSEYKDYWNRQ